jgi:hypothetical protein
MVEAISRELTDQEKGHIHYIEAARRTRGKGLHDRMDETLNQLVGESMPAGIESGEPSKAPAPDVESGEPPPHAGVLLHSALDHRLAMLAIAVNTGVSEHVIANLLSGLPPKIAKTLAGIAVRAAMRVSEPNWQCPEHDKIVWDCRYCLAARLVDGPYKPKLLIATGAEPNSIDMTTVVDVPSTERTVEELLAEQDAAEVSQTVAVFAKVQTWRRRLAADGE